MRRTGGVAGGVAVLLALVLAPAAKADETRPFRLGLRTGYGVPFGRYADVRTIATFRDDDVNALSDDTYGVIPFWLDAGYEVTPHLLLGTYFAFGIVLPKVAPASNPLSGGCPDGVDCAAIGIRAGLQAEYAFAPDASIQPWLALGLGYEWVSTTIEDKDIGLEVKSLHHGPELLQLSGGADFRLTPAFGLGPFATLSALQYGSCSFELSGTEQPCEIEEAAWHGWILIGVRGVLGL